MAWTQPFFEIKAKPWAPPYMPLRIFAFSAGTMHKVDMDVCIGSGSFEYRT